MGMTARTARTAIALVAFIAAAIGSCRAALAADGSTTAPIRPPDALSPEIPRDAPADQSTAEASLPLFEDHAWRTFIALCWPSKADGQRGEANATLKFGDTSVRPAWLTWKSAHEIFRQGADPGDWNSSPDSPADSSRDNPGRLLSATSKSGAR